MGNRRQSRVAALSFLYQNEYPFSSTTSEARRFGEHFSVPAQFHSFFYKIIEGVQKTGAELDSEIETAAENWKLYRMSKIDRSILRIAIWELSHEPETDYRVIIDEAVEIAKIYGAQDSAGFVNGILDRVAKKVRAGEFTESIQCAI